MVLAALDALTRNCGSSALFVHELTNAVSAHGSNAPSCQALWRNHKAGRYSCRPANDVLLATPRSNLADGGPLERPLRRRHQYRHIQRQSRVGTVDAPAEQVNPRTNNTKSSLRQLDTARPTDQNHECNESGTRAEARDAVETNKPEITQHVGAPMHYGVNSSPRVDGVNPILGGNTSAVLPFMQWSMLGLLWGVSTRGDVGTQCVAFLISEVLYAGLHLKPLLPLLQPNPEPDAAYTLSYTTAAFFAGEVALLCLLGYASPLKDLLPSTMFSGHIAMHVFFTGLSAAAPAWVIDQNTSRIKNGWNVRTLSGAWFTLVNLFNFGDFALHAVYTTVLTGALVSQLTMTSSGIPLPAALAASSGTLVAGTLLYAALGEILPAKLLSQQAITVSPTNRRSPLSRATPQSGVSTSRPVPLRLRGRTVLVTGGSSGIGRELARMFYEQGARVIITSPSQSRADAARRALSAAVGTSSASDDAGAIEAMELDLACARSVARFARDCGARFGHLDVVVHNAATSNWWPYRETDEGVEINMAVNYLGPFRLTQLLLPLLSSGADTARPRGRVVVVASTAYKWSRSSGVDLSAFSGAASAREGYTPWRAYGESKLACLLFAQELARRAGDAGGFDVVAIHPGITMSGLQRHMGPMGVALNGATRLLGGSPRRAAAHVLQAVTSEAFLGRGFVYVERETEARLSETARNTAQAQELWEASGRASEALQSR